MEKIREIMWKLKPQVVVGKKRGRKPKALIAEATLTLSVSSSTGEKSESSRQKRSTSIQARQPIGTAARLIKESDDRVVIDDETLAGSGEYLVCCFFENFEEFQFLNYCTFLNS